MAAYIGFQPTDFFNISSWTGTSAEHPITGLGFQPNANWIKSRSGGYQHEWYDSVRGATKYVSPDDTAIEETDAQGLKSFDADGFTVGTRDQVNEGGGGAKTYLSWCWKAGTTSGLTGGTITPTAYSIDATRKFGIYHYTGNGTSGATIAHGLGAAPNCIIIKSLDATDNWQVGHSYISEGDGNDWDKIWKLDSTNPSVDSATYWNDTTPTSTLVTLGSGGENNTNTNDYIMYVWCNVPGMQRFGLYMGNGNARGPSINLGFQPQLVMIKKLGTSEWGMYSNPFPGYNVTNLKLDASADNVENTSADNQMDMTANGFTWRGNGSDTNSTGTNYCYFAWSKFPTVSSNDVPGVAR